jgi:hypothetical protein
MMTEPSAFQGDAGLSGMLRYAWDYAQPGVLILLTLVLAALDARGLRSRRRVTAAAIGAWLLLAVVVWVTYLHPGQHPGRAARSAVRAGNAFHYALGAKYLGELGYRGLYPCALAAWAATPGLMAPDPLARDLGNYSLRRSEDLAATCDRTRFSDARWTTFRQDVAGFVRHHPGIPDDEFRAEFRDKGFNPPPTWALAVRPLVESVDLGPSGSRWVLALPDMAVLAGVLALAAWRLGALRAALTGLFLALYFGTFRTLLGNVGQYLWLLPLAGAVLAVDARRMRLGGVLLGLAGAMQVFPLVFAAVPAWRWATDRLRGRPDAVGWGRFLVAAGATTALGILAAAVAYGPGIWTDFAAKIAVHTRYLSGELFDIGWRNAVATLGTQGLPVLERLAILDGRGGWFWGGLLATLAAWAVVARRSDEPADAWLLGFVPFYFLTVASPYYYLALGILVLDRRPAVRLATFALPAAHFPLWAYADRGFVDPDNWMMHAFSESFLLLLLAWGMVVAWRGRGLGPGRTAPSSAAG